MRILRKTVLSVIVPLFSVTLLLFVTTLCAAACSDKVTMSFETFGGTKIEAISLQAGVPLSEPVTPTKEGYVFVGWYLDKSCEGTAQSIPATMPDTSVTYYARFEQYPSIHIDCNGGAYAKSFLYVKEGTPVLQALQDVVPTKFGLTFGGWLIEGEPLSDTLVMPEEDITVTARYIASYRVEIYLQSAQSENEFELARSTENIGWEGATATPEVPKQEHFNFWAEKSSPTSQVLDGGNTVFRYYFKREACTLTYHVTTPLSVGGNSASETLSTYYGAPISLKLPESAHEGYAFFGWATAPSQEATYFEGDTFFASTEDKNLYSVWGKSYLDGRGSDAVLAISEIAGENGYAVRRKTTEGVQKGYYSTQNDSFTVGETTGRIDGYGNYLLSDSGNYTGYSPVTDSADETLYGTLSLNFAEDKAQYQINGATTEGRYEYVFDGDAYTGDYLFKSQGEEFYFRLKEGNFLRQGEEKKEYYAYDCFTGEYDKSVKIVLDGFGGALVCEGDTLAGSYLGAGENEWKIKTEQGEIRIFTCVSERTLNGNVMQSTPVFLKYQAEKAGSFASAEGDTLALDGYGYRAEYTTASGFQVGVYLLSGDTATVYFANGEAITFSLNREEGSFLRVLLDK